MKKKLNCILLVDDDVATNYLTRMVLEEADVAETIETTLNGKEALAFLTNTGKYENNTNDLFPQPSLIFLDINMPVMDGWEFLDAYQKLPEHQRAKIIIVMLTTSLNPDDKIRAETATDVTSFRNKPMTEEMVLDIVRTHFPEIF
jgi:CheY-like chemotaxis protein